MKLSNFAALAVALVVLGGSGLAQAKMLINVSLGWAFQRISTGIW